MVLPNLAQAQVEQGWLQTKRNEYCAAIFVDRLYKGLSSDAQGMLSCVAVYNLPVTLEGLAAVVDLPEAVGPRTAKQWQVAALMSVDRTGGRDLWSVYGMLRGWLLSSQRLGQSARRAAHKAAGNFLVRLNARDRESDLEYPLLLACWRPELNISPPTTLTMRATSPPNLANITAAKVFMQKWRCCTLTC